MSPDIFYDVRAHPFVSFVKGWGSMAVLVWKHGTTAAVARNAIQAELANSGHASHVAWKGDEFTSSIGWGTILNTVGSVNDESIILEKCSGAIGGIVLAKSREFFERVFPGGELS